MFTEGRQASIGYVLMGFPRVSETFIASELHRVERAGVSVRLFVLKPVEERERGLRHPVVDAIAAEPQYLPDTASLTAPLHRWRPRHLKPFLPALRRTLRRRPLGVARAVARARRQAIRDRRTPLSGPRKIYIKELVQAIALADRVLQQPDVRHLHAHFAHGTTTVTWHAATIAGLPFSFTGHARDIYAPELNPKGWLRRKLLAARFAVTCTQANVAHLKRIAPEAQVHLVYHGLNADFARLVRESEPAQTPNGTLRVLGVGRLVAKKGFDVFVDACAELRRRDVPFEALIVGQDDKHGDVVRERIAGPRPRRPHRAARARWARTSCCASTAAPARWPCRAACSRTTATGSPTCSSRRWRPARPSWPPASPASPSSSRTRSTGCWSSPTTRPRSPTRSIRLHEDRELADARRRGRPPHRAGALRRRPPRAPARRAVRGGPVKPVFSVIEHLHRDREVAEDAAAGRFTCAGETLELGTEPDWLGADLPADEEWRIDWVKFYYGLDLAHAYRTTGDARYRDTWERLVRSYLRQVPPDCDPSEVTARRLVNWIYAWQGFGPLPNGLEPALAERIAAEARHVRDTLTPERNHRTLELYALAIVALRLRRRRAPRPCGRRARPQPRRGLPARRRAPRVLDALPHDRPALVRRPA